MRDHRTALCNRWSPQCRKSITRPHPHPLSSIPKTHCELNCPPWCTEIQSLASRCVSCSVWRSFAVVSSSWACFLESCCLPPTLRLSSSSCTSVHKEQSAWGPRSQAKHHDSYGIGWQLTRLSAETLNKIKGKDASWLNSSSISEKTQSVKEVLITKIDHLRRWKVETIMSRQHLTTQNIKIWRTFEEEKAETNTSQVRVEPNDRVREVSIVAMG